MIKRKRLFLQKKETGYITSDQKKIPISNIFFFFGYFPNYDGEQVFGHHKEINREWRERHGKVKT